MFQRLRHQLTGWYLSILAVVLVVFALGTVLAAGAMLRAEVDEGNRRALAPILQSFASDDSTIAEIIHELSELALAENEHLALLTPRGRVLYARGLQLDPEPAVQRGVSLYHGRAPLRLFVEPLERDGTVRGYLRIGRSVEGIRSTMHIMMLTMAAMIPLALLIAWLGGRWLAAKAVRPIEEAMARERQFTRDASHELRTPLSVVLSQAQLALDQPEVTPALQTKLEVIVRTVRKMGALVEDLLTLGRGDAGIHGKTLRFSLEEVVEEEVQALESLAAERGIRFELSPATDGAWVDGDPGRLAQVVRNLLDNALRYGQAPIRIGFASEADVVSLSVSNAGEGISPGEQARLFDRFHRSQAGRALNPDGTGLGLAIARAIARAHRGDLTMCSTEAATVFTLRLPRATDHA